MSTVRRSVFSVRGAMIAFAIGVATIALGIGCNRTQAPSRTDTTKSATTTATTSTDTSKPSGNPDSSRAAGQIAGKALDGQKLFYNTSYGKIKEACAGCHSDGSAATKDTRIRPGHTLAGVSMRTSTWNGEFTGADLQKNAYGATRCAVAYLHKSKDLKTALPQADIDALNAYFDAIKNNPGAYTKNLKIQWVTQPQILEDDNIDTKAAGAAAKTIMMLPADPNAGQTLFPRTCQYCHGMKDKKSGPAMSDAFKEAKMVAQDVRVGSGAMPFYAKDILSDQQIADVVAYIQQQIGK